MKNYILFEHIDSLYVYNLYIENNVDLLVKTASALIIN